MESVIISGNSKKDIYLLVNIAKKMGLTVKFVKESDLEDFGIGKAIIEGKTDEFVDADDFLKSLKS
jgi:hypothetical protein